jgi:hypothetical protein
LNDRSNPKLVIKRLLEKGKLTQEQYKNYEDSFFKLNEKRLFSYFVKYDGDLENAIAAYILEESKEPDKKYLKSIEKCKKYWKEVQSPRGQRRIKRLREKERINKIRSYGKEVKDKISEYEKKKISKSRIEYNVYMYFGFDNIPRWLNHNNATLKRNLIKIETEIEQARYNKSIRENAEKQEPIETQKPKPIYTYKILEKYPELKPCLIDGEFKPDLTTPELWNKVRKIYNRYRHAEYKRQNNLSNYQSNKSHKHKRNRLKKFGKISHNFTLPTEY